MFNSLDKNFIQVGEIIDLNMIEILAGGKKSQAFKLISNADSQFSKAEIDAFQSMNPIDTINPNGVLAKLDKSDFLYGIFSDKDKLSAFLKSDASDGIVDYLMNLGLTMDDIFLPQYSEIIKFMMDGYTFNYALMLNEDTVVINNDILSTETVNCLAVTRNGRVYAFESSVDVPSTLGFERDLLYFVKPIDDSNTIFECRAKMK